MFCAFLSAKQAKRLRPDGRWLILEDIREAPYRLDRYFASFKLAGWFDRLAGLIIGDFHTQEGGDLHAAILELLRFHLPPDRRLPVVTTHSFGHTWPMLPVLLNQPVWMEVRGRNVTIGPAARAPCKRC